MNARSAMNAANGTNAQNEIEVTVNGNTHSLEAGSTLGELLQQLGHEPNRIATAVNGDFVARVLRAEHRLEDGDRVHCFQPIGGG